MKKQLLCLCIIFFAGCTPENVQNKDRNINYPFSHINKGYTIEELNKKLKDKSFDVNEIYEQEDGTLITLIGLAAADNDLPLIKTLLKHGAKINDEYFIQSALMSTNNLDTIEFLLQNGADVNQQHGMSGVTRLHLAAIRGDKEMVELLLKYGADVSVSTCTGNLHTPLHLACSKYSDDEGVSDSVDDWWGLKSSRKPNYLQVIKLLIAHGGDLNKKDKDGNTPFDLLGEKQLAVREFLKR